MWLLVQWMDESKPNLSYAVVNSDTLHMRPLTRLETGQLIFIHDSEMQARRAQILKVSDDRQSVEQFKLTLQRQDHQVQSMLSLCMSNFKQMKGENMCVPLDLPLADETIDVSSSEEESELNYEIPPKLYIHYQHEGDLSVPPRSRYSEPPFSKTQVSHPEARRTNILDATQASESIFADSPLGDHSGHENRRRFDEKPPHNIPKKVALTESDTQAESKIFWNQNLQRVMQMFSVKSHADNDQGQTPFLQRSSAKTAIVHQCKCTLRKQRFDSNRPTPEKTQPKKATADKAIQTDDHDKELQENVEQLEAQLKGLYTKFMKLMIHLKINSKNSSDSHAEYEDCECHFKSKKKITTANNVNEVEQNQNYISVPNVNVLLNLAAEQNQPNLTEVSLTENKYSKDVLADDNYKGQKDSDGESDNSDCSLTYDSKLLEENQTKFRLWIEKTLTGKQNMQINNNNSNLLVSISDNDSSTDENQNKDARDSISQKNNLKIALNNVDESEPMQLDLGLEYNFAHKSLNHHRNEKAVEKEASNVDNITNEFPKDNDLRHKKADNVRNCTSDEIQPANDQSISRLQQPILTNGQIYNKMDRHYEDIFNEFNQFRQEAFKQKANASLSGPELFIPPVRPSTSQARTVEVRRASAQTTTNCGLPRYSNVSERNPLVPIGAGNVVLPAELLNHINWNSASVATRQLLQAIFPREVLGTHSLSGRPPRAFPDIPPKQRLDPVIISDIVSEVMGRCGTSKQMIRQFITSKCADEAKLYRIRWQGRQNMRQSIPNNFEDQENNPPSPSIDSDSM